ncbi:MAG TPA: hypothetical protein ENJ97_07930, partial [Planctomycetes bacterium]|nr:hypothetical protein [Planctomycetota bacterium]
MGKKGDSDSTGKVPGAPLGAPEPHLFSESPKRTGTEEGPAAAKPPEETTRELKRLERILERVTQDLKEALEGAGRDPGMPPPPMPSVVVHKIETPEIFASCGEKDPGEDQGRPFLQE